jgi:protein-tyrosine phosphatase
MTNQPVPVPESYWVIPGLFLAGEYPIREDIEESIQRINAYLDSGIDTFINLTEMGELVPYESFLQENARNKGITITCHRFPIVDYGLPSTETMKTILDTIDNTLAGNHKIYLHCWGGVGRTGTTVGCYLVRHGKTGEEALSQIAEWWKTVPKSSIFPQSPETKAQQRFILNWKE